jgi:hypothetical protein
MPFSTNKQRRFLEGLKNNPAFAKPINLAPKPLNVSHVPSPLQHAMNVAPHAPPIAPIRPMAAPVTPGLASGGLPPVMYKQATMAAALPPTTPPLGGMSPMSPSPSPSPMINRFKGIKAKLK